MGNTAAHLDHGRSAGQTRAAMENLIVFGFLIALAVASGWWGDDSRDRVHSQEEELTSNGVSWWNPSNARDG